jgi:cystathionine beta-lyase
MAHFDFDTVHDRRSSDSNKWNKFPADVLPLWVADMDFASPPAVVHALHARVDHGFFGYLRENPELPEVVAERVAKRYGWRVSPAAVVMVPGVNVANNFACSALAAPGEGVLLQTPAYPPILRAAGNLGRVREEYVLARDASGRYVVDLDAFAAAMSPRTRAFLLCSPHNPVGRAWSRADLEGMAAACLRRDLWIVADEIHCDLLLDGRQHVPIASLSPEIEQRTITFMAPSKTFNLPGLKCAVAIVPNPKLRERLTTAMGDLMSKPNVLGHTAAVAAYREGDAWLEALLAYLAANRDFVVAEVRRRLPGVRVAPAEATYLAWLDCRGAGPAAADPCTFFLERARVALNDGKAFGPGGEGFVRLNFGCPRALLTEALERMARAF